MVSTSDIQSGGTKIELSARFGLTFKGDLCTGGGFGVLVLACAVS
jgi:hypothetical protein